MSGKTERAVTAAIVALGALAGIAIAGIPQMGSADPIAVQVGGDDTAPDNPIIGADPSREPDTTEPAVTSTAPTTTSSTTEPEIVIRPAEEVTVLVANGTSVPGAAARLTDDVEDIGHPALEPLSTRAFDSSEVWFTDGYEPEALNLAAIIGVFPDRVVPVPADADFDIGAAHVVVIVGPDLAERD